SNVGTWMQNVARSWLIFQLGKRDPLYLGLLGLSFALPMVIVPPLGGAVADRIDRVKLLYVTQTASLLIAVILAVLAWENAIRPWHILATTFVGAVLLGFDNPARQSLIADIVPREILPNAVSLNAATFSGAALVGPALAGILLDAVGAGWLFMLNAISFLFVLAALCRLERRPPRANAKLTWGEALFGGARYVAGERRILVLLLVGAVAALCARSYQQILPVFSAQIWNGGASGYGVLLSAGGAGALAGAFGLASLHAVRSTTKVFVMSGVVLAISLVAFALMPTLVFAAVALVAAGASSTIFTTMISTIVQLEVPPPVRGRVLGLYTITLIGLPSLGSFGLAAVARRIGAPEAVIAGGVLFLVALAAAAVPLLRGAPKTAEN
ncbi:MAG: MFS transporter, partial [Polyangiaceae bacterium]